MLRSLGLALCLHRPLREDPSDAEWEEAQEEEDDSEKKDPEPLFQRVLQLRDPFRADSGAQVFWVLGVELSWERGEQKSPHPGGRWGGTGNSAGPQDSFGKAWVQECCGGLPPWSIF